MNEQDYGLLIEVCTALVLLLAPFAGIHRAVRRVRAQVESCTPPI